MWLPLNLGWTDLVAVTVQRQIELVAGQPINAAIQVLWPDPAPEPQSIDQFDDDDVLRAAIFDVVVEHGDHSHNWTSAPGPPARARLRLYDNAYAFGSHPFQSAFYDQKQGQPIPSPVISLLKGFLETVNSSLLPSLLDATELTGLISRTQRLIDAESLAR